MRKKLSWANLYYRIYNNDKLLNDFDPVACFIDLEDYENATHIEIYNIACEITKDYTKKYINYIIDMLKLEDAYYDEVNDVFFLKTFNNHYKTMLVGSLIRFLNEFIGYNSEFDKDFNQVEQFLKPLFEGKCKYKNKLKRFCYFYSKIKYNFVWHTGHSWKPKDTKIKSTQEYLKYDGKHGVNYFFTN